MDLNILPRTHTRIHSVSNHGRGGPAAAGSTTMSAPQTETDGPVLRLFF